MPPCMELSERLEREGKGGSSDGEAGTQMIVWVVQYNIYNTNTIQYNKIVIQL